MKDKGCLILGYIATISGYILGVATALHRMLNGVAATELLSRTGLFFPTFSPPGLLSLVGTTLFSAASGLSACGTATSLPCAAAGTYLYGVFSAANFAAYGWSGILRFLWATPMMIASVILLSAVSGDGVRGSFFTLRRLGLIPEAKGQYTDVDGTFDIAAYLRSSLVAITVSVAVTAYGHFTAGYIFP